MTILTNNSVVVNSRSWSGAPIQFADQTYGEIANGLLTIHRGQRTGADDDWGGQVVGSVELDKAIALLGRALAGQDAEVADLIAKYEAGRDAGWDAVSSHWGQD